MLDLMGSSMDNMIRHLEKQVNREVVYMERPLELNISG